MGVQLSAKDINASPVLADWLASVKNSDLAVVRIPGTDYRDLLEANLVNPIVTPGVNSKALAVGGYSLTGADATSMIDLAGTWNTTGTPTAILLDILDTASNAASLLMDLQVGSVSKFSVSKDAGLYLTANLIEQRNGVNAQDSRIYNTFTDASNYEYAFIKFASNIFRIGMNVAGTGVERDFYFKRGSGKSIILGGTIGVGWKIDTSDFLVPMGNVLYDIGTSSLKVKDFNIGGRIISAMTVADNAAIKVTGYSLTGASINPMINLAGTWNTSGAPTAILLDILNTASDAASLLMDLKIGGTSQFNVGKSGIITALGHLQVGDGTKDLPALRGSDVNSGLYFDNSGVGLVFSQGGIRDAYFGASSFKIASPNFFGWGSSDDATTTSDLKIYRDAANILGQRNGVNGQEFRLYNTFTDAANHERVILEWVTNVFQLRTESAGTGSDRSMNITSAGISLNLGTAGATQWTIFTTTLEPFTNNTDNLGSSSKLVKNVYIGTSLLIEQAVANANAVKVTGHSLTSADASSMIDLAGIWNTTGVPTAIKLNITNTASGADSLLMDLQVGGASKFKVDEDGHTTIGGSLKTPDSGALTIASDAVTVTGTYHTLIGEGAAADDIATINGGADGKILIIQADSDTVTITATEAGNLKLAGGSFAMDNAEDTLTLLYSGALSAWVEISRSDNGAA